MYKEIEDEEYQEFLDYIEKYYKEKQMKKEKFKESFLYSIYNWCKENIKK